MAWTSFLPYRLRSPSVSRVRQCASFTVSSNMARTASTSAGVATARTRCASERNRKWIDSTPDCGDRVAALADALKMKSMSPVRIFCSICGSWPSCAPGNWSMIMVPLLSSASFAAKMSAPTP